MKSTAKFITTLLAFSLSLVACNKEEDRPSLFTLNNIEHITDHGYKKMVSSDGEKSVHYVYLCSPEIGMESEDITGYGDYVVMLFLSESPAELISGEYSYDDSMIAAVFLGFDEDIYEGTIYSLDSDGETNASIRVDGSIFEIEYSIDVNTGKTIKGYYKGTLENTITSSTKSMILPAIPFAADAF